MEMTCHRCHQPVKEADCFCPACGLPQLVYTDESNSGPAGTERWTETARDAASVDWKPGVRAAAALAVPAGLLSSLVSPVSALGILWITAAAVWAVTLYMRSQRPAWITMGAGARIGLVTGLMAAWLAFTVTGGTLFVERYNLHQGAAMDGEWKSAMAMNQQWMAQLNVAETPEMKAQQILALSPWGHAGYMACAFGAYSLFLVLFAMGGGALGARLTARARRPEV